jgi:hypothetical protein
LLIFCAIPAALAQTALTTDFARIKSLQGVWEGTSVDGKPVSTTFSTTAGGFAVIQMFKIAGEPEKPTVYHYDGDRIMLTHYCSANNQPRMVFFASSESDKSMRFRFLDATNLLNPDAGHMHEVAFHFVDAKHFRQEWTWREKGTDEVEAFNFVRKQ